MIIIFDYGGVISSGHIRDMYENLYRRLDVVPHEFNAVKHKYIDRALNGSISGQELVENIAQELGIDPETLKEQWMAAYAEAITVNPDVMEIIMMLKPHHRLVLLTNVIELDAIVNRKRGDYDPFEQVFTSYECKACKPGFPIYQHLLQELRADPRDCVFIDNAEENLMPAAAMGMRTIHFRDAAHLKTDLHRMGLL